MESYLTPSYRNTTQVLTIILTILLTMILTMILKLTIILILIMDELDLDLACDNNIDIDHNLQVPQEPVTGEP